MGVNTNPASMNIVRLLGNNLLVRFLDKPKPQIGSISIPIHMVPHNPFAVVLMIGEGRLRYPKREKRKFRGYTRYERQRHERQHLENVEVGDVVHVNLRMGRVPVDYKGQSCHIISTLDVNGKAEW